MAKYVANATDDWKALWTLFVPTSIVQFSIMPMHMRGILAHAHALYPCPRI